MSEEKYEEALETFWGSLQILLSVRENNPQKPNY